MTRITFHRENGIFTGFSEVGHSGYAEEGEDIVCAAVSAMTMLVINTIDEVYHLPIELEIDERRAAVTLEIPPSDGVDGAARYAAEGLLQGFFLQLSDMAETHRDCIRVDIGPRQP